MLRKLKSLITGDEPERTSFSAAVSMLEPFSSDILRPHPSAPEVSFSQSEASTMCPTLGTTQELVLAAFQNTAHGRRVLRSVRRQLVRTVEREGDSGPNYFPSGPPRYRYHFARRRTAPEASLDPESEESPVLVDMILSVLNSEHYASERAWRHLRGASQEVIESHSVLTQSLSSLPATALVSSSTRADPSNSSSSSSVNCVVCMTILVEGRTMRVLPCGHAFHRRCVDPWLRHNRTCPVCRLDLVTKAISETSFSTSPSTTTTATTDSPSDLAWGRLGPVSVPRPGSPRPALSAPSSSGATPTSSELTDPPPPPSPPPPPPRDGIIYF